MKHLGDITKIDGHAVPIVDCVIGGSPCQDLSVAGKRAGLAGERSGLFMDHIRIIKEMRDESKRRSDKYVRPRFAVWENVFGAFSSNGGEDFRCVLEEFCRIADPAVSISRPANGRWEPAGEIVGDGWSLAWRTHDAQYWGVPQRRRRISVIMDFGTECAGEILFECAGVSRNPAKIGEAGKETPGDAEGRAGADDTEVFGVENHPQDIRVKLDNTGVCQSLTKQMGTGGNNVPMVMEPMPFRKTAHPRAEDLPQGYEPARVNDTLNAFDNGETRTPTVVVNCVAIEGNGARPSHQGIGYSEEDVGYTLNAVERHAVAYGISSYDSNAMKSKNPHSGIYEADTSRTLDLNGGNPACNQGGIAIVEPYACDFRNDRISEVNGTLQAKSSGGQSLQLNNCVMEQVIGFLPQHKAESMAPMVEKSPCLTNGTNPGWQNGVIMKTGMRYIVRRLTPMECERLQGFPDGWTDIGTWTDSKGKKRETADSARYKALGNSIALPFWRFLLRRISSEYLVPPTMCSLFDGIGGFPLIWESINGKGTAVWASEIEEFPMAVTKYHFGGD